ncbi:MAG: hypothetical protein JSR89_17875 [Proteobacteria bacterium]|nr:hypothetical protein [Pseudomonadota bacterium]
MMSEFQQSSSDVLTDAIEQSRMIGIADVRRLMAGMSVRQIDRLIDAGRFPPPTFISPNRRAWRFKTVVEFLNDLERTGRTKRAGRTRKQIVASDLSIVESADGRVCAESPHFNDDEIPF